MRVLLQTLDPLPLSDCKDNPHGFSNRKNKEEEKYSVKCKQINFRRENLIVILQVFFFPQNSKYFLYLVEREVVLLPIFDPVRQSGLHYVRCLLQ